MPPAVPSEMSTASAEFEALKRADRADLATLPPHEAQAAVDAILQPRLWRVEDPAQLEWPGDLADNEE